MSLFYFHDKSIRIVREGLTIEIHECYIVKYKYNRGRMLYSGSIGGLVRVWDLIKQDQVDEIIDFQDEESIKMWRKYPELDDLLEWAEKNYNS